MHVVTTWIGNSALIAAKHYLQVTDAHFAKAALGDADSDARMTQIPAQHVAALPRTEGQETQKPLNSQGVLQEDAIVCDSEQNGETPRT